MDQHPRTCQRCGLPEGRSRVRLNADGICNFCGFWEHRGRELLDTASRRSELGARFLDHRAEGEYTAAAGLSGGKDSTFVLHQLRSEYRIPVLAMTFDNGFLTEHTRDNVRAIVDASGVDHILHRPDWDAFRAFYRGTLLRLGDPCIACSIGGYALAIKASGERRIPFFVHGRSPMQMFRSCHPRSRDPGLATVRQNLSGYRPNALRRTYRVLGWKLRWLLRMIEPDRTMRRRILAEFFGIDLARKSVVAEFLAFFLFEPYDEEGIKRFLETRPTGYRRPSGDAQLGHGDCLIHDACGYLYQKQHGVTRVGLEVAMMRRSGQIDAKAARAILEGSVPRKEELEASIDHLLSSLDVTRHEFDALVRRLERRGSPSPLA
ncbi:MAG: hypothetical protein JSW65_00675 [Candidatus Bipolaricaulota bacterium]|nr:MAG: hypothetical protein JSW65_00675 [Candidatus Bipolaricaulota bacterium]